MIDQLALVGNPNTGKSTLFNTLTGAHQNVGNWPGVTIEKKSGTLKTQGKQVELIDLPGVYGLSAYTPEEAVVRDFMLNETPEVVFNVVDATNLERNLYLTLQLKALCPNVIVLLNMTDALSAEGIEIDVPMLSEMLELPVYSISALYSTGIQDAIEAFLIQKQMMATAQKLTELEALEAQRLPISLKQLMRLIPCTDEEELEVIQGLYAKIDVISKACIKRQVVKPKNHQKTLDAIFTNRWLGLPIFALMMYGVFWITFSIGGIFQAWVDQLFNVYIAGLLSDVFISYDVSDWLSSLVIDGIVGGVGGVLTFVPIISMLFLAIAFLEDSGYMARVAYIMDRLMRKMGLNGKAIVPMLMGFGCNTPAIMGTRIIDSEADRLIAILINPFISCGARLPIYVLLTSVFFKERATVVTFSLYILGMAVAIGSAKLFKSTLFKGEHTPFILELPPYRRPRLTHLYRKVAHHTKGYLFRAGTIIFFASTVIWFLLNFGPSGYGHIETSFGKLIGVWIAPLFSPLGFGHWQSALSLLTGIVAKEIVISNMSIIYQLNEASLQSGIASIFTPTSAYAFMVFSLLYVPCIAVLGIIKSETGRWRWVVFSSVYALMVAWGFAWLVYRIGEAVLNTI